MTCAQTPPPLEAGVSQSLAKWRAANYSDVRYKLNITLEKAAPLMKGEIEIRVNLTEEGAKNDLILDWRTTQFQNDKDKPDAEVFEVNGKSIIQGSSDLPWLFMNEHIIISSTFLKQGENVIKIKFASPIKASGAAITRYVDKEDGAEYVYSLFVPSDASTAFPVFDQPDLKAKFSLSLTMPEGWKAVSNTSSLLNTRPTEFGGRKIRTLNLVNFAETKPISTYVFAFAAGDFKVFEDLENSPFARMTILPGGDGELMDSSLPKIYVRKSQAEKFKAHEKEVFRLNREGVKFLESYFNYKFPFPKYDLVLIPEFPFGGMEHAGCTFLREASVIFPSEPTKNDYVSRANVIFHEAAHQWFGDTVTMRWFDDLWLKEGFAEFMAYKTLEKVMPEYNAWKIFYERNKQAAYLTDSTRGTTPIYQEIANLSAAKSAYGNIVYRKAPSFLKQAEFYLGEKEFQTAVRAFLKKHEFANAEWTDLVNEFETTSGKNLKDWANIWVKKGGLATFRMKIENPKNFGKLTGTPTKIKLVFSQSNVLNGDTIWSQKLQFFYIYENGKKRIETITLEKNDREIEEVWGVNLNGEESREAKQDLQPPKFIFTNYQDYGYGIFLLDEKSRAYVLENIQTEKDDFLRTMMWGSLWDSVREAELAPADYVELVIKNLAVESDESTIQTLLGRVSTAMNYYLNDAQRNAFAPRVEALLVDKIANAKTQGQRITFYRAYLNLASSAAAAKNLKDILAGKSKVAVFQLKTKDKFDIVTRLLILGDKDAPALLTGLEKTETSDEAKRYAYAARAGVGSADTKAKYFKDFLTDKDLSESWIEAAFVPFNSPRHSDLTQQYLETALSELPNLKRSRKIFFINGWLGAFIGGQKSEKALAIVNKFLADNPNLDKDLRLKILENADGLERAVKIRGKFGK
ncbi:MAG TPA: M1 family aminopeptidase [Pyrinomonadaceae bacterium]|nr:M1 family aminopeptidase [Pyrinomonadaceae bacterium]